MPALRAIIVLGQLLRFGSLLAWRFALARLRGSSISGAAIVAGTLAELCKSLGPVYIKLGQILGTRRDLFGDLGTQQLALLQDCLPSIPSDAVIEVFRTEFRCTPSSLFAAFEWESLASGSIATVFRARMHDGRPVAVKVRRPTIETQVRRDLRLMRVVARGLARAPGIRRIPLVSIVDQIGTTLERQIDFRLEAASNRRVRAALSLETNVRVPALIEELCGDAVLTMEFLEAFSESASTSCIDRRPALRAVLRALYRLIFVDGLVHCDMHPGNLRLGNGGEASIVDFGLMADLPREDRLRFAEFFFALSMNDGARCARVAFDAASSCTPWFGYYSFESEVVALVSSVSGATAGNFSVARFLAQMFDIQRRNGLYASPAFAMAALSLLVLEGLAKEVDPELDFQREAHTAIFRASIRPYHPWRRHQGVLAPGLDTSRGASFDAR